MGETGRPGRGAAKRPALRFELLRDGDNLTLVVVEGVRKLKTTRYHLEEFPVDFGRGFTLAKWSCDRTGKELDDGAGHQCNVDERECHCSCMGAYPEKRYCRHVTAVRELIERGEL